MFSNYFKVLFRNLRKQALFSFINIFGLAIGMACSILILLWVQDELSYDSFNKNADDIYRVVENQHYAGGKLFPVAVTPGPLAPLLKEEYPEVLRATRFEFYEKTLRKGDKIFDVETGFADPDFLKIFTFPLLAGSTEDALKDTYSILLSQEAASKFFQNEDPLDKFITINDTINLKVTGILKNVPGNSHIKFEALVPFEMLKNLGRTIDRWGNNSYFTYIQLKPGTSPSDLDKKIKGEIKKHNKDSVVDLFLQPLLNIHLYSAGKFTADIGGHGNIETVNIFLLIALVVLLIACINFMNLSTARGTKRSREVGMRKVIGADRKQIIIQFYTESILFALFALIFALAISDLALNSFNNLAGKNITFTSLGSSTFIGLILLTIFTGILAGSYPALYLSSFSPIKVLKSDASISGGGTLFRKVLVVTQFSLSLILIIGTIIITSQLNFIRNKNLGFSRENVLGFVTTKKIRTNLESFKSELLKNPGIISAATSNLNPMYVTNSTSGLKWPGKNEKDKKLFHFLITDKSFLQTFKMKMAAGRYFTQGYGSDSTAIVLNEEAVKAMELKNPVGTNVTMWEKELTIIGVLKNFNFKPLDTKIEPMVLRCSESMGYSMYVRLRPENLQNSVEYVKDTFRKFAPLSTFNFHFLDEDFDSLYRSETRMRAIFEYFAGLALIISCLGLFGLASFIAERRTKEIGIRKVLGANIFNLTYVLSLEFTKWVLISNIIAWPVAYFLMNRWLQGFAYRTAVSLWVFPAAGLLVLLIALFTVSYQAIKAALSNPVNSLKYE